MSTGFSGKDGTLKKDSAVLSVDVSSWNFEGSAADHRYGSDKTGGHKVSVAGTEDSNIRARIKLSDTYPVPWNLGDTFTVQLHVDGTGNNYIQQAIVVLTEPVACDMDDGAPSEYEYLLGPRGAPIRFGNLWGGSGSSGI